MSSVQLIALFAALAFFLHVAWLTGRRRLRDKHAFFWLAISATGVVMAFSLPALDRFAGWLGVSYMPALVFTAAFLFLLAVVMLQTVSLSKQQEEIKTLAQELAYLRCELSQHTQKRPNEGGRP